MKFTLSRTSEWDTGHPLPGDERVKYEPYTRIDERCVNAPEKLNCMTAEEWLAEGTNHRADKNSIYRDMETCYEWTIEIESLEDLLKFHKKNGPLIIGASWGSGREAIAPLRIEIYDDYRE